MLGAVAVLVFGVLSETRPELTWQQCTKSGCTAVKGSVVNDVAWRGTGGTNDIDYKCIGVESTGTAVSQKLVTTCNGNSNVGSRLYLLSAEGTSYELFKLLGKEFTYTVDLSQIPCGLNAALYTAEMPATGKNNNAQYGGGYCDGNYVGGSGCAEFDIQEANSEAMVFTTHACQSAGVQAGDNQCDKNGCGLNVYRFGAHDFFGPGKTVDTKKPVTVVTQFVAEGGDLVDIRRLYVQGGKVIPTPTQSIYSNAECNSVNDTFCKASGSTVDGWRSLASFGRSLERGHVLIWALWDSSDGMGWLDGNTENGPCGQVSGSQIEAQHPDATVTYSDFKFGDIDTTY